MRKSIIAALSVAAIGITAPAIVGAQTEPPAPRQAGQGQTTDGAAARPTGCQTKRCEARVAAKRRRADARWCARHRACRARVARKRVRRMMLATIRPHIGWLRTTGDCENANYGGPGLKEGLDAYNPSPFYGRYQFTMHTWQSVGGRGDPRNADWLEQAYRAVLVLHRDGRGAWPVCG